MDSGDFTLRWGGHARTRTLLVGGELDLGTTGELVSAVEGLIERGAPTLTLDLSGVTFMDSTGLHAIVTIRDLCETHGCELAVTPGPPQVQRVFEITRVDRTLPFRGSYNRERRALSPSTSEAYAAKRRRFADVMVTQYVQRLGARSAD